MSAPEVGTLCSYFVEEEQSGLQDTVPHKEGKVGTQIPLGLRLYSLAGPEDISVSVTGVLPSMVVAMASWDLPNNT